MTGQSVCTLATAHMWNTPEPGASPQEILDARRAIAGCGMCPLAGRCPTTDVVGQIVDGVPYNRHGVPLPKCEHCGRWCIGRKGDARYCGERCFNQARVARRPTMLLAVAA